MAAAEVIYFPTAVQPSPPRFPRPVPTLSCAMSSKTSVCTDQHGWRNRVDYRLAALSGVLDPTNGRNRFAVR